MADVPLEVENEELSTLALAWAKTNKPDAYQKTLKVAVNPTIFRTYLLRLIEIRYETDRNFRFQCPIRVLDETSLKIKVRHKDGTEKEYCGKLAKGDIQNRIFELGLERSEFQKLQKTKTILDLEYVHD